MQLKFCVYAYFANTLASLLIVHWAKLAQRQNCRALLLKYSWHIMLLKYRLTNSVFSYLVKRDQSCTDKIRTP